MNATLTFRHDYDARFNFELTHILSSFIATVH